MDKTTAIFNEKTFYPALIKDMLSAEEEVIIYSPFISRFRANFFKKTLIKLNRKKIRLFIFTRPIEEHEGYIQDEIRSAIKIYESLGAHIIYLEGTIHQKVAVIDKKVLWEGSMNILSQRSSKEIMTRITDVEFITKMMSHLGLNDKLAVNNNANVLMLGVLTLFTDGLLSILKWLLTVIRQIVIILVKGTLAVFNILDVIL